MLKKTWKNNVSYRIENDFSLGGHREFNERNTLYGFMNVIAYLKGANMFWGIFVKDNAQKLAVYKLVYRSMVYTVHVT